MIMTACSLHLHVQDDRVLDQHAVARVLDHHRQTRRPGECAVRYDVVTRHQVVGLDFADRADCADFAQVSVGPTTLAVENVGVKDCPSEFERGWRLG